MNVTFRQIKLFIALAETGSVSAAAKAMHVTQPTASMQLKEISQSVGLPLYEVISKKIYLTEAGKELANTGRVLLQTWDAFEQKIDESKGLVRGKLKLAVVSTAKYFIPKLIGQFCNKYPGIDVSLEIMNRDGIINRIRENLDDLYIMSQPPKDIAIKDTIFLDNPLILIAPSRHPLAKLSSIPLSQLLQERFIVREKGSGTRMAIEKFFKKKKFKLNIRMELGSNEAIKETVAAGLGLGIVSEHALHGKKTDHGVTPLRVNGFPILSQWHIVYSAKKQLSPIALGFRDHLTNSFKRPS